MNDNKRLIEFFLYPDATGLDIVGPLDVFSTATRILNQKNNVDKGYKAIFSAERPGQVQLELRAVIARRFSHWLWKITRYKCQRRCYLHS